MSGRPPGRPPEIASFQGSVEDGEGVVIVLRDGQTPVPLGRQGRFRWWDDIERLQLAVAILDRVVGAEQADRCKHRFAHSILARFPPGGVWSLSWERIQEWVELQYENRDGYSRRPSTFR